MESWSFLTSHARVLLCIAHDPGVRLRDIAASLDITERSAYGIVTVALDRNELGVLLLAAGLGPPLEHALISLLALNGLRVSEVTGADIEHLGT